MPAVAALNEGRDRNPGDTRRAATTVPSHRRCLSLNEGRDRNPGDTRTSQRYLCQESLGALNEGRDRNPGDTHDLRPVAGRL